MPKVFEKETKVFEKEILELPRNNAGFKKDGTRIRDVLTLEDLNEDVHKIDMFLKSAKPSQCL